MLFVTSQATTQEQRTVKTHIEQTTKKTKKKKEKERERGRKTLVRRDASRMREEKS